MTSSSDLVHRPDIGPEKGPIYKFGQACIVLKEKEFTDFIVQCEDIQLHVQRAFLYYYKSPFLRAALDHNFKEQQDGILVIGEAKPRTVAMLILYCYTNILTRDGIKTAWPEIFPEAQDQNEDTDALERIQDWCELYRLADRIILQPLRFAGALACTTYYENMDFTTPQPLQEVIVEYIYRTLATRDELCSTLTSVLYKRCPGNSKLWQSTKYHDSGTVMAIRITKYISQGKAVPISFKNTIEFYRKISGD